MTSILHITNGDAAVDLFQDAGIEEPILPWRDLLHEGPVTQADDLSLCSAERAHYIANQGWGQYDTIHDSFKQRDETFNQGQKGDVILWFEHDLYDQLQLCQILNHMSQWPSLPKLSIIQTDKHLGYHRPEEIQRLRPTDFPVTQGQIQLATEFWHAFCSDNPSRLNPYIGLKAACLPFLADAAQRMAEEFPSINNGLSLTEQNALSILASEGALPFGQLFRHVQAKEQAAFMGDWSMKRILTDLAQLEKPALSWNGDTDPKHLIEITDVGLRLLANDIDLLDIQPVNKWFGGYHFDSASEHPLYRWDIQQAQLVK